VSARIGALHSVNRVMSHVSSNHISLLVSCRMSLPVMSPSSCHVACLFQSCLAPRVMSHVSSNHISLLVSCRMSLPVMSRSSCHIACLFQSCLAPRVMSHVSFSHVSLLVSYRMSLPVMSRSSYHVACLFQSCLPPSPISPKYFQLETSLALTAMPRWHTKGPSLVTSKSDSRDARTKPFSFRSI
jgi:hypothetical protein